MIYGSDGRGVIRLGDRTDHGGVVVSISRTFTDMGKPVACVGDLVECPKCKGKFRIVQGDQVKTYFGMPVAYHGDKTECGATLISSWGIKGVPGSTINPMKEIEQKESFDEAVKLIHESVPGIPFFIETSDGKTYSGRVNESGTLPRIFTLHEDYYKIYWGDEALAKINEE